MSEGGEFNSGQIVGAVFESPRLREWAQVEKEVAWRFDASPPYKNEAVLLRTASFLRSVVSQTANLAFDGKARRAGS